MKLTHVQLEFLCSQLGSVTEFCSSKSNFGNTVGKMSSKSFDDYQLNQNIEKMCHSIDALLSEDDQSNSQYPAQSLLLVDQSVRIPVELQNYVPHVPLPNSMNPIPFDGAIHGIQPQFLYPQQNTMRAILPSGSNNNYTHPMHYPPMNVQNCGQRYAFDNNYLPGPLPMLTAAAQNRSGHLQKFSRPRFTSHHNRNDLNSKIAEEIDSLDFESARALFVEAAEEIEKQENNPVFRIFYLFQNLDIFISAKLPDDDGVANLRDLSTLPHTMNVQVQVKHAARRIIGFIGDQERILNVNKFKDPIQYDKCAESLHKLGSVLVQFESFKRIDMEHRQNEFVSQEGKINADYLETCLQQLCDLVRECSISIHLFNWDMEERENEQRVQQELQQQRMLMQSLESQRRSDGNEMFSYFEDEENNAQRDLRFIGK